MLFDKGIRATIRPKHGTVLGIRSTEVVHYTSPIICSNGWQQLGIALVHKKGVVTGCERVFAAGQRARVLSKALCSKVTKIATSEAERAGEVMAAVEQARQEGKRLPHALRASVKRQLDDIDGVSKVAPAARCRRR